MNDAVRTWLPIFVAALLALLLLDEPFGIGMWIAFVATLVAAVSHGFAIGFDRGVLMDSHLGARHEHQRAPAD